MNVLRRGTVSMALFVSGVISIPAVVAADCHHEDGDTSLATARDTGLPGNFLADRPGSAASASGAALGNAAISGASGYGPNAVVPRSAVGAAAASTSVIAQARIRGFVGISRGATVSGQVQIRALVSGTLNAISYRLAGDVMISYDSLWQPYLFSPDGMGLDTTKLPNGVYTLTAMPRDSAAIPASITFRVANRPGPVLSSLLASGSQVRYYNR